MVKDVLALLGALILVPAVFILYVATIPYELWRD